MTDAPLERLAGTWDFEPMVDGRSAGTGRATFEPIENGAFLLQRSSADWTDPGWIEHAPRVQEAVIGLDDTSGEIVQLYADDRGVRRIYRGSLTDEAWTLERSATGFHQRFIGRFLDGGRTIEGRWESSPDGSAWELDFPITYRRLDDR